MITTITRPDEGQIFFAGEPLNSRHPEQIGYMPEERGLYKKMKVGDHLMYLAQLKGLSYNQAREEIKHWLVKLDIVDWWGKKVEELSKGMQQKAQFISTVIHKPRLLILDEPFSGLDPVNAELLKNEIYQLHKQGTSMNTKTLANHYSQLSAEERFRLIVAADDRGDEAEKDRLANASKRIT